MLFRDETRNNLCTEEQFVRDASPRDFSSLQTESPRQGYMAPAFSSLQTELQ